MLVFMCVVMYGESSVGKNYVRFEQKKENDKRTILLCILGGIKCTGDGYRVIP